MKFMFALAATVVSVACAATLAMYAQAAESTSGGRFSGPLGLQLYSLRDSFAKDVPGTLDKVKALGFKNVELAGFYGLKPEEFKKLLAERGLTAVSGHWSYDMYRDQLDEVVREATAIGVKYAGCAWIAHQAPFDEAACRAAAAVFNQAGAELAKHGIQFFYHIHGYEFQPHNNGTLFDLLAKETKPELVTFEMDVFWVVHPGQSPLTLLGRYPNRFQLTHLKDMRRDLPTGVLTGQSDPANDVAIGTGQIDFPAFLAAAEKVGIKWHFIEDESPSVERQIPESLKYLNNATW